MRRELQTSSFKTILSEKMKARNQFLTSLWELILLAIGTLVFSIFISLQIDVQKYRIVLAFLLFTFLFYMIYVSPVLIHKDTLADRGLGGRDTYYIRTDNLRAAARNYGIMAILAAVVILAAAHYKGIDLGDPLRWRRFAFKLMFYLPSALLQDLCFLGFILPRVRDVVPGDSQNWQRILAVSALAAGLFAVFHVPNIPLIAVAAVVGFAATTIFQRTPNILPAAVAHAFIGAMLHRIFELNMRIGQAYWHPEKYFFRELIPGLKEYIGAAF